MRTCTRSTVVLIAAITCGSTNSLGQHYELKYEGSQLLPNVQIDGGPAAIHTQGLYVDDAHFFVTGRLETAPKRALLLRFERANPQHFEYIDITPKTPAGASDRLDHPGGFDFDGTDFWIPVARSSPAGPSVITRVEFEPTEPLSKWQRQSVIRVDDHVGAVAYEPTLGYLYGANWDTKKIHIWERDGTHVRTIDRTQCIDDAPDWSLAVQDWKAAGDGFLRAPGVLVAGGIDKSPRRDPNVSAAVVDVLLPKDRRRLARIHLPSVDGYDGPMTREGLALYKGHTLFLLPGDLGRDARVYRYRCLLEPRARN